METAIPPARTGRTRTGTIAPLASLLLEPSLADPAAALAALTPLLDELETVSFGDVAVREPALLYFVPAAIECQIMVGQHERAARLLERFDASAWVVDRDWAAWTSARCRCLLLAARGELDAADAAATDSLCREGHRTPPFERARTLLLQGQVRRRRREKRAAEQSIMAALELFESVGSPRWADRARTELGRLGVRCAPDELTATEDHVAALAASGMSNKQVAARLFISPSTVKSNLAKVYVKLGVTGRAQLALAMAQRTAQRPDDEPDQIPA